MIAKPLSLHGVSCSQVRLCEPEVGSKSPTVAKVSKEKHTKAWCLSQHEFSRGWK